MAIALLVAASGAALLLRSVPRLHAAGETVAWGDHLRAAGLAGLLALAIVLMPWLGYAPTIALLALSVAAYAGARRDLLLPLVALGLAAVLWLAFVGALGVPFPRGTLTGI